jgi:hypothetical protein
VFACPAERQNDSLDLTSGKNTLYGVVYSGAERIACEELLVEPERIAMEVTYIPAVAAFSGSVTGALATALTSWITQRRKDRALLTSRTIEKREKLYKSFIEEASRLYADALVKDKSEISQLVDLYALIGRMKILSSDDVIEAAEKVGQFILQTYLSPNRTFVDLPELLNKVDPLRDFSEVCRRELQAAQLN